MSTNILRWSDENRGEFNSDIIEEGALRKVIRKALTANQYDDIEGNIDLIFTHLKNTSRLATGTINVSGKSDVKIVKLAPIGS